MLRFSVYASVGKPPCCSFCQKILDLEKNSDYDLVTSDPDLFLRLNPNKVALDESQLLPPLFSALRVAIDSNRHVSGRYIITGPSSPELIKSISESLAGRVAIIEVAPLSIGEAYEQPSNDFYRLISERCSLNELLSLKVDKSLDEISYYWLHGGYPEPWVKNNPRFRKLWLQNYLHTYIERDIIRLFPGLNREKYRLFIQILGHLSGNIINYSDVARTLGISQPTVREYFQIAHGTFIWRHIPAYEKNVTKRIIKHPKGYIRDTGLLHFILHLNDLDMLLSHPQMGHSWESMVIENLLRELNCLGVHYDYYHYRTGGGAEIDLILEGEFGLLPIEIKYNQRTNQRNLRALRDFIEEHNCPYGIVINNDEQVRQYDEKIIGIPFACL
ncbi:hypothetical protein MNBD_GAMMA11-1861 [hydrothermal vent metagenome]|uniref:ATPase n=1 Tax=hydrothermal vent metagenome TaxID=652676 RepID=A0A3B0XCG7_9ZZZZ